MADALPGRPSPLGATPRDGGINFAVASSVAEAAEVCLFDEAGQETRFRLPDYDGGAWHGFVPGIGGAGQAYGFRVRGPYDTARGLRCNPAKLLLDPYARAVRVEAAELGWFTPAGTPMTQADWADRDALALGVYLDGSDAPDTGPDGQPLLDDDFLVLVNAWWEPLEFTVGDCRPGLAWRAEIDTFDPAAAAGAVRWRATGSRSGRVRSWCCAARGFHPARKHPEAGRPHRNARRSTKRPNQHHRSTFSTIAIGFYVVDPGFVVD